MQTNWRGWVTLGRCVVATLLLGQAGCLLDQLRTSGQSTPAATKPAPDPQAAGAQKGNREPSLAELALTSAQAPNTLPAPSQPQQPKIDPVPGPYPPQKAKGEQLPAPQVPTPPAAHIGFATGTLSLKDLIQLAVVSHPDLTIAQARVEMARGQMIQAGLYPNPRVSMDLDALGARGNGWGDPGLLVAQEIVTCHKLKVAKAAAGAGVQAADWDATTRWFEVVTRVRHATVELLVARHEVHTVKDVLEKVTRPNLDAANKLFKAGVGSKPDVLRAETELELTLVQQAKAQRRLEAARALLAAAVGVAALPAADVAGDLDQPAPIYNWPGLQVQILSVSSEVQAAQSRVLQMQGQLRRAELERYPNLHTELRPFYSTIDRAPAAEVIMGADLPVFNRNQGNIQTARAEVALAEADVRRIELNLAERLADAFRRYQVGLEQTTAYRERILKKARESLDLVQKGYKAGDPKYNFTALLQAQQILFQAELSYVAALEELWRAVADIEGLMQRKFD